VNVGNIISARVIARPAALLIAWGVRLPAMCRKFSYYPWNCDLLMQEQPLRSSPDHLPQLCHLAPATSIVLSYCDEQRTVAPIKEAVLREYLDMFPSSGEIPRFVDAVLNGNTK